MASNDSDGEYTGHPLFPIPMDRVVTARRRFDLIQINRILPDKKTRETCPILFNGSDLRSWQQILDMFGGECYYQLQGVCSKNEALHCAIRAMVFQQSGAETFFKIGRAAAGSVVRAHVSSRGSSTATNDSHIDSRGICGTVDLALAQGDYLVFGWWQLPQRSCLA